MDISPIDRDLTIRTILSEAGDQSDAGKVAVANVIRNRVQDGSWGSTPRSVVLARRQFSPWDLSRNDPNHPYQHDSRSPEYQKVGQIVDGVFGGQIPDIINGATHFLDPELTRKQRGSLPSWVPKTGGQRIGEHVFYQNPDRSQTSPIDAINAAIGAKSPSSGALAFSGEPGSLFKGAGFDVPSRQPAQPTAPTISTEVTPAPKPTGSIFEAAGFKLPGKEPVAPTEPMPAGAASYVETPGGTRHFIDAKGNFIDVPNPERPSFLHRLNELVDPLRSENYVPAIGRRIGEAASSSASMASQGVTDITQGRTASGVGKAALGALGVAASPLTGLANALSSGVTSLTGSPETGERVGFVAGGLVPGGKATQTGVQLARETAPFALQAAKSIAPNPKSINALVDAIGPENVASAVERLRANPRLTLADVSDPVRLRTQGLVDPAQPHALGEITNAVKQRVAEGPTDVNYAYTSTMGPAPDVVRMVEGLKERARDAGRKEIHPALQNSKPVDTTPVVKAIDDIVKPGLQAMLDPATKLPLSPLQQELIRLKQQLVAPTGETLTDAGRLHDVQSRLGDMAYQLQKSSDSKDRLLGGQLRSVNEKLIDRIDEAAGGAYRPAREKFKDAKDIHQAFEEGFDVLKNRSGVQGLEDRPEALKEWMKTATPEEVVAKKLGVRADIDQKIRGVKNQVLAGTNITKIEYNREKLTELFGGKEANRLIRSMDDAADIAKTNAKLLEGSKTAETLAARESMKVPQVGGGNPLNYIGPVAAEAANFMGLGGAYPGLGTAAFLAAKGGHLGLQKVNQFSALARNAAFARNALATGPAREETINRLLSHPKVVRQLKKSSNALTTPSVP